MLGRFTRPDPANSFSLFNPQSLNRYSYVFNNPIRFVDPDGAVVELANEKDRAFFEKTISRGSRNALAREIFLFLSRRPERVVLSRAHLGSYSADGRAVNRLGRTEPSRLFPQSGPVADRRPTHFNVMLDEWNISRLRRDPAVTVWHEFAHVLTYLATGLRFDQERWDWPSTPGNPNLFERLAMETAGNPDDSSNGLTPSQVGEHLRALTPEGSGWNLENDLRGGGDPMAGTGFCPASNRGCQ